PVLASLSSITVSDTSADDSFAVTNASLSATDRDSGASLSYSITSGSADTSVSGFTHSRTGTYGTLYINSSTGDYRYIPDDTLVEQTTSTVSESFEMSVSDGTSSVAQTLSTSIQGVNDAPVLSSLAGISFTDTSSDDSFSNATASASGSDRDSGASLSYSITSASADTSVSGYTHSLAGTYGRLHINETSGNYVYVPDDSAIEGVKTTVTDQFTISVSDGSLTNDQILTTTINGANDAPILGSLSGFSFTDTSADDSFSDTTGTASATDRDSGETISYTISGGNSDTSVSGYTHSLAGSYGTLYINSSSGAYLYDVTDSAVEGASSSATDSFTIVASDGTASSSSNLVASITGVNDRPELASVSSVTVADTSADDSFAATNANLSGTDRDTGASLTYGVTSASADTSVTGFTHSRAGTYGTLYVNSSSGAYRYIPNDSVVEALSSTVSENFEFTLTDGRQTVTQSLSTSIQGVNDAPDLAAFTTITYNDTSANDSFAPSSGTASGSDRDSTTNLKYGVSGMVAESSYSGFTHIANGTYGDLVINQSTGAYQFIPSESQIEALSSTVTETFTMALSDGTANATNQTLTITLNGVDDIPVIDTSNNPASNVTGSAGARVATITDAEGAAITDSSSDLNTLPSWLSFGSSGGGVVSYYWEIGANAPAWLNGTKAVQLKGTASGTDSSAATVNVVFACSSDHCGDFAQSSDAVTPVLIDDASNIPEPLSKDELVIGGTTYTFMTQAQRDALFDTNGNASGSFRVVYTADEAGASSPGTWSVDQRVAVDYSKQELTVNSAVSFSNIEYFDGDSGSFNDSTSIDISGGQNIVSGNYS
ncbi:MAG: VCBS domain-containing protein, partial [Alphaproteobacteria bacterium]|nr:VCBS domain-containing protein [Alphaproteobacteria bacterium]